jgi:ABC-type polysaccharide/polyol phosphate export permease
VRLDFKQRNVTYALSALWQLATPLSMYNVLKAVFALFADSHQGNRSSIWCQTWPILSCAIQLDRVPGSDE